MTRRRAGLVAGVAAVLLTAAPASAYHHTGNRWGGSGVRQVAVVDKTGDAFWRARVANGINTWNAANTNVRFVHQVGSGPCVLGGGRVEVCLTNGGGGLTRTSWDSSRRFTGVLITFNRSATQWGDALACHELGHALGLAHRQNGQTSSCMTASIYPNQTRPDRMDIDEVRAAHTP